MLKDPLRRKATRGARITMSAAMVAGIAGSQLWNNAWLTCAELVGTVDLVRTHPRDNHLRQPGSEGAEKLPPPQQLRQLGDVHRNPPRFVRFDCNQNFD